MSHFSNSVGAVELNFGGTLEELWRNSGGTLEELLELKQELLVEEPSPTLSSVPTLGGHGPASQLLLVVPSGCTVVRLAPVSILCLHQEGGTACGAMASSQAVVARVAAQHEVLGW